MISSALQGTISGSSVANVVGTGSVTIPLMKSIGYRPEFAAAVEAAASTGGQLMPPIMGAAAFVMSEFLNVPYYKIAAAAAIPALLYFTGIFFYGSFGSVAHWLKRHSEGKPAKLASIDSYPLVLVDSDIWNCSRFGTWVHCDESGLDWIGVDYHCGRHY